MAAVSLELPDDVAVRFFALSDEERRHLVDTVVVPLIEAATGGRASEEVAGAEEEAWWAGLSDAERQRFQDETAHSLAAIDAGRVISTEELLDRGRTR